MSSEHNIIHTDPSAPGHVCDLDDPTPSKESETVVLIRGIAHIALLLGGTMALFAGITLAFYAMARSLIDMLT